MIVKFMLHAIGIHDDVPSQLTVLTQMKALIREHFVRLLRTEFLQLLQSHP